MADWLFAGQRSGQGRSFHLRDTDREAGIPLRYGSNLRAIDKTGNIVVQEL